MVFSFIKKIVKKSINIEHWKLILMGILFITLSSFIVYYIEPKEFKSPFNGFWFVMTTVSQVGFGDYIPNTMPGRLYTVFIYLVGIGFFAIMVAKWIDLINNYEELKEMEILGFAGKNHVVLINWSQKSEITLREILETNKKIEIVLIDQMNNSPITHERVHYIQGIPTKPDVLRRAHVLHADSICIFADDNPVDLVAEDGKSLLTASIIKHLANKENLESYVITEILDEEHISNIDQTVFDEIILSNKPFSHLMASTALRSR